MPGGIKEYHEKLWWGESTSVRE